MSDLALQANDPGLDALNGIEGALQAALPARQGSAFIVQSLAELLDLALLLLIGGLGFEHGADQTAAWLGH
jgi:hypothetical protein